MKFKKGLTGAAFVLLLFLNIKLPQQRLLMRTFV